MTKTDRIIKLIMHMAHTPSGEISDEKFRMILDGPSKAQYHRYINELTKAHDGIEPILIRSKKNKTFHYTLNPYGQESISAKDTAPRLRLIKEQNHCEIRVYKQALETFKNLNMPHDVLREDVDHIVVRCMYEDTDEYLSTIFAFAEHVEVISPESLQKKFVKKAEKALFLNMTKHYTFDKKAA